MNTILVSYDLSAPGRDYPKLQEHLESYGDCVHLLESVWLVKTNSTALQVCQAAEKCIDQNDKIFVIDVTNKFAAWNNLDDRVSEWLKSRMRI